MKHFHETEESVPDVSVPDEPALDERSGEVLALLERLQGVAPWKPGWRREELGRLLAMKTGRGGGLTDLLEEMVRSGLLQSRGAYLSTPNHQPQLPAHLQECAETLLANLYQDGVSPRDWELAVAQVAPGPKEQGMLEEHFLGSPLVQPLTEKLVFHPEALKEACALLRERSQGQPFTTSLAREWLQTSRKFIIPVLEWMDEQGLSRRDEDERVMLPPSD